MSYLPPPSETRPAFVIGVTGNIDPDFDVNNGGISKETLIERLNTLFLLIRYGWNGSPPSEWKKPKSKREPLSTKVREMVPESNNEIPPELFGLDKWPGIGPNTELILLTSLAPGADTITAEALWKIAKESYEAAPNADQSEGPEDLRFVARVKAPLPFPADLYPRASTFTNCAKHIDDETKREDTVRKAIEKFNRLIGKIGKENQFAVLTREDIEAEGHSLDQSLEAPREEEKPSLMRKAFEDVVDGKTQEQASARRLRYQAAGEYITTFSDLLIAVYDDLYNSGASEGSNSIVEGKRWGADPELLPLTPSATWADNGPVFHLYHPRIKANDHPEREAHIAREKPLRILHPYDLGPKDDDTRERLAFCWDSKSAAESSGNPERTIREFSKWQKKGNLLLAKIGRNLSAFNELSPPKVNLETALKDLDLDGKADPLSEATKNHIQLSLPFQAVKKTATEELRGNWKERKMVFLPKKWGLQPAAEKTLKALVLGALFGALSLHIFSHWHPYEKSYVYVKSEKHAPDHGNNSTGSHDPQSPAEDSRKTQENTPVENPDQTNKNTDGQQKNPKGSKVKIPRLLASLLGLFFASFGLLLFQRFHASRAEEKRHDYRALSEALRVQFFWAVAGLRRTVAGNYMQRLRSEMDWIRNALSSITFPAERFQASFLQLSEKEQLFLFKQVVEGWVRPPMRQEQDLNGKPGNKYQQDYYYKSAREKQKRLHLFHQTGTGIALAGLVVLLLLIYPAVNPYFEYDLWKGHYPATKTLLTTGLIFLSISWILGFRSRKHHAFPHLTTSQALAEYIIKPGNDSIFSRLKPPRWVSFATFFGDLFPHHASSREGFNEKTRLKTSWRNFFLALIPSAGAGCVLVALCIRLAAQSAKLPGIVDIGIVAMGACFVGGALMVAYAERQLLSEHTRSYRAAHSYFNSARLRLERELQTMKAEVEKIELKETGLSEYTKRNPQDYYRNVNQIWEKQNCHPEKAKDSGIKFRELDTDKKRAFETEMKTGIVEQIQNEGREKFGKSRERVHKLLFALGKEALDENSEWLILHRARPMEPVMAG